MSVCVGCDVPFFHSIHVAPVRVVAVVQSGTAFVPRTECGGRIRAAAAAAAATWCCRLFERGSLSHPDGLDGPDRITSCFTFDRTTQPSTIAAIETCVRFFSLSFVRARVCTLTSRLYGPHINGVRMAMQTFECHNDSTVQQRIVHVSKCRRRRTPVDVVVDGHIIAFVAIVWCDRENVAKRRLNTKRTRCGGEKK